MGMRSYSHSQLEEYEECPRMYWYHRVQGVKPLDDLTPVYFHLGAVVHEVIQHLYESLLRGKRETLEELLSLYEHKWEKGMDGAVYFPPAYPPEEQKARGKTYIEGYYRLYFPFNQDRTLWVEHRIEFSLDETRGLYINGKIDRLGQEGDGLYIIHDLKTSYGLPPQKDLVVDRQIGLYTLGVLDHWKDAKEVWAVWHYLHFGTEIRFKVEKESLKRIARDTLNLIGKIEESAEEDFSPDRGEHCNFCGYRHLCHAWDK